MKLKGTFTYLGVEKFFSSKKNQWFNNACFLQGTDVQKSFATDEQVKSLEAVPIGQIVDVEFDIRVNANSTFVNMVSVTLVNIADKAKTA